MNTHLLIQSFIERLGWTLVHSLWQGGVIALLLALVLRFIGDAARRHAVCLGALLLVAACSVETFRMVKAEPVHEASLFSVPLARPSKAMNASVPMAPVVQRVPQEWSWEETMRPSLPWLCGAWVLGVVLLSLRQCVAWTRLRRWRVRHCESAGAELEQLAVRLCERFRIRRAVRVLKCAQASVPMLLGWFRPAIILPAGVIAGLSTEQLEAILAHELAHLRRGDVLVLWLQRVMETLYFFHPGVRWIIRRLQIEREHGCDDLAVAKGTTRETLAAALGRLALWSASTDPVPALAATGHMPVAERIRRLLQPPAKPQAAMLAPFVTLSTLAGVTVFAWMTISGHQPLVAEPALPQTESPRYAATAKLIIQWIADKPLDPEARADFRGTQIEILQSGEVKRRGLERIRGLHPELKEIPVEVHAARIKDSSIIEVTCTAQDPKYARVFTDMIVDEYLAFKAEMVEKSLGSAMNKVIEEVLSREKMTKVKRQELIELQDSATSHKDDAKLQMRLREVEDEYRRTDEDYQHWKKTLENLNESFKTMTEPVSVMERPAEARKVEGAAGSPGSH